MTKQYIYMIRHIKSGMFSSGKSHPTFSSKNGKQWASAGAVNSHLTMLDPHYMAKVYDGCEMVAFELVAASTLSFADIIERTRRKTSLFNMHKNDKFSGFLDQLRNKELVNDYPWVIFVETNWKIEKQIIADAKELLKTFKISKANFRTSFTTFAFTNKEEAAKFRIGMSAYTTHAYNGITLLDVDTDDKELDPTP